MAGHVELLQAELWYCYAGITPSEKLKATKSMVHQHVLLFPVMLLEDAMKVAGSPQQLLSGGPGGTYVYTTCQKSK